MYLLFICKIIISANTSSIVQLLQVVQFAIWITRLTINRTVLAMWFWRLAGYLQCQLNSKDLGCLYSDACNLCCVCLSTALSLLLYFRPGNGEYWWNLRGSHLWLNCSNFYGNAGVFMEPSALWTVRGKTWKRPEGLVLVYCYVWGAQQCKSCTQAEVSIPNSETSKVRYIGLGQNWASHALLLRSRL